jgi:hypothetical protein
MQRLLISTLIGGSICAIAISSSSTAQRGQVVTPPKARYAMDLGTTSGLAVMAGRGLGGAMGMVFGGGGGKEGREMHLRLGSTLSPAGAPKADHLPSAATKQGKAIPLTTPERVEPDTPQGFERPRGRMLLYWGCGERAPKGQPVIIDFAKVAAGQMPPNLFSARVPVDRGPTFANSKTFGDWPRKGGKAPPPGSSVLGEHRVVGNYSPEMKFTLTQDYLPAINGRASPLPSGATTMSWNSVAGATGYLAWVMGMKMDGGGNAPRDMVWWSSSSAREFGGGLWDWLPPETVNRLIGQKVVMPPSQTSCIVPAEVKAAAPDMMMGTLYAYGPEANFVYPPRPTNPATPWVQEWTARVRYRSSTMVMMAGPMMGNASAPESEKPRCKPSIMGAVLGKAC